MSSPHTLDDFLAECECSHEEPTIPEPESGTLPDNSNRTALYQVDAQIANKECCLAELKTIVDQKRVEVAEKLAILNASQASLSSKQAQLASDVAAHAAAVARKAALETELAEKTALRSTKQTQLTALQAEAVVLTLELVPLTAAADAAQLARDTKNTQVLSAQDALTVLLGEKTDSDAELVQLNAAVAAIEAAIAAIGSSAPPNADLSAALTAAITARDEEMTRNAALVVDIAAQNVTLAGLLGELTALDAALETAQAAKAAKEAALQAKNLEIEQLQAEIDTLSIRIEEIGSTEESTTLLGMVHLEVLHLADIVENRTSLVEAAQAAKDTAQTEYDEAKSCYDDAVAAYAELEAQIAAKRAERQALVDQQIEWEVAAVEALIEAVGSGEGVTEATAAAVSKTFPSSQARDLYDDIVAATPPSVVTPPDSSAASDYHDIALHILEDPSYYYDPSSSDYALLGTSLPELDALMRQRSNQSINDNFAALFIVRSSGSAREGGSEDHSNSAGFILMVIFLVLAVFWYARIRR